MSYGYVAYLVDLSHVREALGKNDQVLAKRIEEQMSEDLDEVDEIFEDEIAEGGLSVRAALAELLEGRRTDSDGGANQYCYAFETLCKVLGEQLIENDLTQLSVRWIAKEAPEVDTAFGFDKPWSADFLPEPQPFPALGFVLNADIARAKQTIEAGISKPGRSQEALGCLKACASVLERAAANRKDLAVFLY